MFLALGPTDPRKCGSDKLIQYRGRNLSALGQPQPAAVAGNRLSLENCGEAGFHHSRKAQHVPVRHPNATARFRATDCLWLVGAVDAIVFFGKVKPCDSYGPIWPRRQI